MKILAEDLARLCYNAAQFSAKDSGLGGVVWFCSDQSGLAVFASDDYVALVDRAESSADFTGTEFHLGLKEVKELERWLRDKDGPREIFVVDGRLHDDEDEFSVEVATDPPDFSPVVEIVHSEPNPIAEDYYPASRQPFAIRAERFTKFRLLRTPESPSCKDGYPLDLHWDGRLVRVKCGPYLRAVIGPLTRYSYTTTDGQEIQGIRDLYRGESEVLWDEAG